MSESDKIEINKMIVHKVDHLVKEEPDLSQVISPISNDVRNFLQEHVATNREHIHTRNAIFITPDEAIPQNIDPNGDSIGESPKESVSDVESSDTQVILKDLCDELLIDSDNFVLHSQDIAKHLFQVIKNDKRISPGNLIIYTFSEGDDDSEWLAFLKVDPKDGFIDERKYIDGKACIILKRVPDILPTGELQKCAFILPQKLRDDRKYDLRVLDQQVARYQSRQLVASFFVNKFLQCKVGLNRKDKTKAFSLRSYDWVTSRRDWDIKDRERFKRRVNESLDSNIIDIAGLAQAVIPNTKEQDEYLEYMREHGFEELTFEPDPKERQRLMQYVWFEGDDELKVRIKANALGPDKVLHSKFDESTNIWTITIKTTHWEETVRGTK